MKRIMMIGVLLTMAASSPAILSAEGDGAKYRHVANTANWKWSDAAGDPLYCAVRNRASYGINLVLPPKTDGQDDPGVLVEVRKGDEVVYKFAANPKTPFFMRDERLTYVAFSPRLPGGEVVHVDLSTGRERWRKPLQGVNGEKAFFNYVTRFNLELTVDAVMVWGNEAGGKYLEVKSLADGETLARRVFAGEE